MKYIGFKHEDGSCVLINISNISAITEASGEIRISTTNGGDYLASGATSVDQVLQLMRKASEEPSASVRWIESV